MITLDTSGILALLNKQDVNHRKAVEALARRSDRQVVPVPILAEVAFVLESRGHAASLNRFLGAIGAGELSLDCREGDLDRAQSLMTRYRDLSLGFSDSITIACAERRGGQDLSFDFRHFGVVAREGTISLVPGFEQAG